MSRGKRGPDFEQELTKETKRKSWYQPQPQILASGPGFGVQGNRFQFTISWATNTSVVVLASTNLLNGRRSSPTRSSTAPAPLWIRLGRTIPVVSIAHKRSNTNPKEGLNS